ncbi:phosphatase PAP2 family protein [Halorubrum sp. JWXQ-INN 858]|uniref:phosphatase PAP2 family protein n=1 Tax=Halorubrum sp. JWXQ-INN 858 TaxID=2690782 RepID=UPI0013594DAC|nr:phosphatase PAP2 family protein [Halorubrum sp. JWXQ-INN 858]MWV65635.1 phosphatase PAP2 family protein [Halorubrum sp. JWXQ-INN 858]
MTFVALLAVVVAVALVSFAILLPACVGVDRLRAALERPNRFHDRLVAVSPFIGGLAVVLLLNKGLLNRIEHFSHRYGVEATMWFYAVEGDLVATVQDTLPDWGLYYFGPMYVFGYVVLLVFPLVAYLFASSLRPIKTLVTAYAINYAVAVGCYAAVLAYGPRNYHRLPGADPDATRVEEPLLDSFREVTQLTARVNVETNVFPSLHTSLSVTVLLLAVSTHEEFPRWTPVAALLAGSIVLATMYLGIHWATDVVAGVLLAAGSIAGAARIVAYTERRRSPDAQ